MKRMMAEIAKLPLWRPVWEPEVVEVVEFGGGVVGIVEFRGGVASRVVLVERTVRGMVEDGIAVGGMVGGAISLGGAAASTLACARCSLVVVERGVVGETIGCF